MHRMRVARLVSKSLNPHFPSSGPSGSTCIRPIQSQRLRAEADNRFQARLGTMRLVALECVTAAAPAVPLQP